VNFLNIFLTPFIDHFLINIFFDPFIKKVALLIQKILVLITNSFFLKVKNNYATGHPFCHRENMLNASKIEYIISKEYSHLESGSPRCNPKPEPGPLCLSIY
jgi:hypothetical protein